MTQRPPATLRGRALAWLAQREHSRAELRGKLRRWAAEPEGRELERRPIASDAEIDALLDELVAAGHLSDDRFVDSRVHARQARFGNRRIQQEFRQLGVTPDPAITSQLRETERQRAADVQSRKFGSKPTTPHERARQMRFLASRGFTAETIHRVLQGDSDEL